MLAKIERNTQKVNVALRTTDALSSHTSESLAKYAERQASASSLAASNVGAFAQKQEHAHATASGITTEWGKIGRHIKSAVAAFGVSKLVGLADTMTSTRARLDLINDGLQTTAELQGKIAESANRARASYTDTAAAVAKLGVLAGNAFGSNDEMIAFAELMNKNFVIGGASQSEQSAAMYQLTQAMAAGKLQGDEFRSIMENAPLLAQAIADFTGKSKGELKEMSAEGAITADIIKGALFSTADEINERFSQMPMTFSQVATISANVLLRAFDPAIQAIGRGAQWIYDNWSSIAPVFAGVAAGVLTGAAAFGVWTAATWLQVAANRALVASMLTNPFLWIGVVISLIVAALYKWIQAVGGVKIAWLIMVDAVLTALGKLKVGVGTVIYGIVDAVGAVKVDILYLIQSTINGAISLINDFIRRLNALPGVNISAINQMTFATQAELEHQAGVQERAARLSQIVEDTTNAHRWRRMTIDGQRQLAAQQTNEDLFGMGGFDIGSVGSVDEVGKINSDVNIADEDLKFMKDVAEMRYVQNFVTLTPTVSMEAQVSERVDVGDVVSEVARVLENEIAISAEGVFA